MSDSARVLDREAAAAPDAEEEVIRLFDETRASLFRYLRWIGSTAEEADDAIQEAFLRLHSHLRSGGERRNLRAWVFRVAGNLVRDERKSGRRRWNRALDCEARDSWVDPRDGPEQLMLASESERRLGAAIGLLPAAQQKCLALRTEGFRYREIAEILGVGTTTVADLLRRAVTKLTRELA